MGMEWRNGAIITSNHGKDRGADFFFERSAQLGRMLKIPS
jgi:hypothetical protein